MLMAIAMKASGPIIKPGAMGSIVTPMGRGMRATGKMIYSMAGVGSNGLKEVCMKGTIIKGRRRGMGGTSGQMGLYMKDSGWITRLKGRVDIIGLMAGDT